MVLSGPVENQIYVASSLSACVVAPEDPILVIVALRQWTEVASVDDSEATDL